MYSDAEIQAVGLTPYHFGDHCDAAIIQANHTEYRSLRASDLGGATVVLDGRQCLGPSSDLEVISLGRPA